MKKIGSYLWIPMLACGAVNEILYTYYAARVPDVERYAQIFSLMGAIQSGGAVHPSPARFITPTQSVIDQVCVWIFYVLLVYVVFRSWARSKSNAPILFPPKK